MISPDQKTSKHHSQKHPRRWAIFWAIGLISIYPLLRYADFTHPMIRMRHDLHDGPAHLMRYFYYVPNYVFALQPDWLEQGSPDEVRLLWAPTSYWTGTGVIKLKEQTFSGMMDNGFSYTSFSLTNNGTPLTNELMSEIQLQLKELKPGENYWTDPLDDMEFHIAFFQNGTRVVYHYRRGKPSEPVIHLLQKLGTGILEPAHEM